MLNLRNLGRAAMVAYMNKSKCALRAAIKKAGSISELARLLGINRQAVQAWEQVPTDRCKDVEKLTGIPRSQLRPDIFQ